MPHYSAHLPIDVIVCNKVLCFEHWVSLRAENEAEARRKARFLIARQIRFGKKNNKKNGKNKTIDSEPGFVFNNISVETIKNNIDPCDLEIHKINKGE